MGRKQSEKPVFNFKPDTQGVTVDLSFAPHVDAEYDLKTRRLLRYEGISNLKDASGKHKKVTITYSYNL